MSTSPTTPTANVTDPNLQSAEEIAAQLAAAAAPAAPQSAEPPQLQKEYVVETSTGQVFRGKTQQEVIDKLKASVENGTATIKQLKDAQKAAPAPTAPVEEKFDQNTYLQMLGEDGAKAAAYALQFTPEAVELRRQVAEITEFNQSARAQAQINEFKANTPDLPLDDASTKSFEETWNQWDAEFRQETGKGLPITASNLKKVHSYCIANKIYAPAAQAPTVQLGAAALPNPTLNGQGSPSAAAAPVNVNAMSTNDLEAYIRQMNGQ
jgi:hypothetical protein